MQPSHEVLLSHCSRSLPGNHTSDIGRRPRYIPALMSSSPSPRFRALEFFAGIGLVRQALRQAGFDVVFANDIEPFKRDLYAANFGGAYGLVDVQAVHGNDVPDAELATAS